LRKIVLLLAALIIIVNIIILFYPQGNKQAIEEDVKAFLNKTVCTEIYRSEEYQLLLELQPTNHSVSDQIRELLFGEVTFDFVEVNESSCTVAINSLDIGELYQEAVKDYVPDENFSFSENKVALLETFLDRLNSENLKYQTTKIDLEVVETDESYEAVLCRDFYNAIYGNIIEVVEIEIMEISNEGDIND